jgi:transposase-like protein
MPKKTRPKCPDSSAKGGHGESQSGPPEGLTAKQGDALEALLQGQTMARAAAAAGVNERTLRRWVHEPVFRSTLLEARREAFGQAIGLTQRYAPVAVATLVKIMNDNSASASAKVTAAATILKFGREGIELDDLAERIEALERGAAAGTVPRSGASKDAAPSEEDE